MPATTPDTLPPHALPDEPRPDETIPDDEDTTLPDEAEQLGDFA